jgi:PhnB protein
MLNNDAIHPKEYQTITPLLRVQEVSKLIDFLKQAFEAKEISCYNQKDGLLAHAKIKIGNSIIMLSDSTAEWKPMTNVLYMYVDNVDKKYQKALDFGATSLREPKDEQYGDRCAVVIDRYGNQWWIATHKENMSENEFDNNSDNDMDESQTFSI